MNWSKIKNIMIICLVVMNLFLMGDIALTQYMSLALPEGTGESFRAVLKSDGIEIEEGLIPEYYEERRVVKAYFYDIDQLSKMFLGKTVNYISDGQNIIAASEGKKLIVTGKSFEYVTGQPSVEKNGNDIIRAMEKLGLSVKGAEFVKNEGLVRVRIDSMTVEGVYLEVSLTESGEIAHLKGVWPYIEFEGTDDKVSVISAVGKICEVLPIGSKIEKIERVYLTESDEKECIITPGWKLYANGRAYVIG